MVYAHLLVHTLKRYVSWDLGLLYIGIFFGMFLSAVLKPLKILIPHRNLARASLSNIRLDLFSAVKGLKWLHILSRFADILHGYVHRLRRRVNFEALWRVLFHAGPRNENLHVVLVVICLEICVGSHHLYRLRYRVLTLIGLHFTHFKVGSWFW